MTPVLLYDRDCGLCTESVQQILRRDRRGTLRFAGLDGELAAALRTRHPELRDVDSVIWVEPADDGRPERVLVRSDAALAVARYVGGWWRLALIGRIVPRAPRDAVYRFVARHRHRLPGSPATCVLPTPEIMARFLD